MSELNSLIFENPGSLDIRFIKIMGVSAKEGDSNIGFFGTGLKYAIATVLRCGGSISIHTNGVSYDFFTDEIQLRDKKFHQIIMKDSLTGEFTPLSFTTDLGKHWHPWMAIRELYSNAMDEDGKVYVSKEDRDFLAFYTRITIQGEIFLDEWNHNAEDYFIDSSKIPAHSSSFVNSYPGYSTKDAVFL